ncbi:uncharacterized protein LOC127249233 [Andrographis paniculata]|uniref:uncharacterized protein LOC127249233 n=1 Tax=Andrographis paniculata TaxID=175694 RepID=UPI0021E943F4|nr:uncharacterized protein LOC127249233 [Andrographis paniculata]
METVAARGCGNDELVPMKKKRKLKTTDHIDEVQGRSKTTRGDSEDGSPWKNLELILSLQDASTSLMEKVDLSFDYVQSSSTKVPGDIRGQVHVMDASRTVAFLSNWVQSVLIQSERKLRLENKQPDFGTTGSFLDIRCWRVLLFCLKESQRAQMPLACSKDFLWVIHSIEMDVLSCFIDKSCCEGLLSGERMQFYDVVLDCLLLIFSFHGGVANENLEMWILVIDKVIEIILKVVSGKIEGSILWNFVLRFACYLFEPFAKFLRVHPMRKIGFYTFISKLFQPLLHLVNLLQTHPCHSEGELKTNVSKFVDEVISHGLFHSVHIDGFLSLQSSNRYRNSCDSKVKEERPVNKSYHRHLFDQVEKIVALKSEPPLLGLGELLHLFSSCVVKKKAASVSGVSMHLDVKSIFHDSSNLTAGRTETSESMDAESRKCVFDFFVHIMESLLSDLNKCLQLDVEVASILYDVSITLRSINSLLAIFIREKLYLRTEDTTDGASQNFLRFIYTSLMRLFTKITHQKAYDIQHRELLSCVRKELIVSVHHLLDIEYNVVEDGLESLWSLSLSSLPYCYVSSDVPNQSSLFAEILSLGCRLIDLYSDLRQVDTSIFAFCRAVRYSLSFAGHREECALSNTCSSYPNSLSMLVCSLEFRRSLSNAVKVIPEGQVAKCIQQLSSDIKNCLAWIKLGHELDDVDENVKSDPHCCESLKFHLQAEILGKVLSDAYAIILESVIVTSGNSYFISDSLKVLIEMTRPCLSGLVSLQPDVSKGLFTFIDGRTLGKSNGCDNLSMCWILKFLFHLLLSCRSLSQEVITHMTSDTSKDLSKFIGGPFFTHSMKYCMDMADSDYEGFFSRILEPSRTLLHVIKSVSKICIQDTVVLCPPLLYILTSMAVQRLVDLNKVMAVSDYALTWNNSMSQKKLKDDSYVSSYSKKSISKRKKEAVNLTKFVMGNILVMDKEQRSTLSFSQTNALNFAIGSLDEKSLLSALWYKICKNVDVWCAHAVKKDLKRFLTLLIQTSLPYTNDKDGCLRTCNIVNPGYEKKVNFHQIDLEFVINRAENDESIWRYMSSRFCRILRKSVSSLFTTCGEDLGRSPDWVEVISTVEKLSDTQAWTKQKMVPTAFCNKQNDGFARCRSLLALLIQIPEIYLGSKSSSYITNILNLERLLVDSLLCWRDTPSSNNICQIFQLFTMCRRVLQILAVASSKEKGSGSLNKLPESSFPLLWLLKSLSAVIEFQRTFPEHIGVEMKDMAISLLDSTSDLLLTVCKDRIECAVASSLCTGMLHGEEEILTPVNEELEQSENSLRVNPEENLDAMESVLQLCKALEEHFKKPLTIIDDACLTQKVEAMDTYQDFSTLSMAMSCFHGLLQGLASILDETNSLDSNFRTNFPSNNVELMTRINSCVDTFVSSMTFVLKLLFLEDGMAFNMPTYGDNAFGVVIPDLEAFFTDIQQQGLYRKNILLLKIISGEDAEVAIFLQQLFIAFSAILRLNLQINLTSSFWSILPVVIGISQFLLLESSKAEKLHKFAICCLDGVVKFLKELGNYFSQFDPSLSRDFFVRLIGLHLSVIGKCISLQGKEAKLASQETGSHAKKLYNQATSFSSLGSSQLSELKKQLRTSFRAYIMKSSKLHLLSAIQAVERALAGVQEGLMANYEIVFGSPNGGEVSSVVAAGIEGLDLILESVTGTKRVNTIKRHIQSLVACLHNIIIHLQGPDVFFGCVDSNKAYARTDSGSVVHMCIEVLTKFSSKPSLFQIEACHVVESLRAPGVMFQHFLQLRLPTAKIDFSSISVDRKFSVEMYASCCRMLCTALKNHKSETQHCIAILQDSVAVLLHCLENSSGIEFFSWTVQEAVICAHNLRRVYEEVRSEKDVLGRFSFLLLSRYISVYCGFGPARTGIIREADDALRPGLYALLDCCSADDLQLLHTQLGDGSCRTLLAELQHEYKIKFRFEGKI